MLSFVRQWTLRLDSIGLTGMYALYRVHPAVWRGFEYIVTAYPPFLKHLRDALDGAGFPCDDYRISGLVGGEGMTGAPVTAELREWLRLTPRPPGYGSDGLTDRARHCPLWRRSGSGRR